MMCDIKDEEVITSGQLIQAVEYFKDLYEFMTLPPTREDPAKFPLHMFDLMSLFNLNEDIDKIDIHQAEKYIEVEGDTLKLFEKMESYEFSDYSNLMSDLSFATTRVRRCLTDNPILTSKHTNSELKYFIQTQHWYVNKWENDSKYFHGTNQCAKCIFAARKMIPTSIGMATTDHDGSYACVATGFVGYLRHLYNEAQKESLCNLPLMERIKIKQKVLEGFITNKLIILKWNKLHADDSPTPTSTKEGEL